MATGVLTGLLGAVLVSLLRVVQHLAFGVGPETPFLVGAERAGIGRRTAVLLCAGLLSGAGWWLLGRLVGGRLTVRAALARGSLPLAGALPGAVLQIVVVALGASLGREGAPRELGAAVGAGLARCAGLGAAAGRVLLAAGAGAGLAAVYDVPAAGVLFALETLLMSLALTDAAVVGAVVAVATVTATALLPGGATYRVPELSAGLATCAGALLLLGPLCGVVAALFNRLARAAAQRAPHGWRTIPEGVLAFAALAALAAFRPEVLGNGRGPAQLVLSGDLALPVVAALVVLKPLATALCLRGGAVGGLLTPSFSTGTLVGLLVGTGWAHLWPGASPVTLAVAGGTAVLAGTMRAPLTAVALGLELTAAPVAAAVPLALAVAMSTLVVRRLDPDPDPREPPRSAVTEVPSRDLLGSAAPWRPTFWR